MLKGTKHVKDICRHFSIFADNPITILHQEMSKRFIKDESPAHKYKVCNRLLIFCG